MADQVCWGHMLTKFFLFSLILGGPFFAIDGLSYPREVSFGEVAEGEEGVGRVLFSNNSNEPFKIERLKSSC